MSTYRTDILATLTEDLKNSNLAVAAWEGGSAATGNLDPFSDIDLTVVGVSSIEAIFDRVESRLNQVSKITHRYVETRQFWPGCSQRVYFLENSPKHFFIDLSVFLKESQSLLEEFMQTDRHGHPVVLFDNVGLIEPRKLDAALFEDKRSKRFVELKQSFFVYHTLALKEIDRGHPIDAYAFYFSGMLRGLVEVMAMTYRPSKYDFGLRYLHRDFPEAESRKIESLLYVNSLEQLQKNVQLAEQLFQEACEKLKE